MAGTGPVGRVQLNIYRRCLADITNQLPKDLLRPVMRYRVDNDTEPGRILRKTPKKMCAFYNGSVDYWHPSVSIMNLSALPFF